MLHVASWKYDLVVAVGIRPEENGVIERLGLGFAMDRWTVIDLKKEKIFKE